MCLSVFVCLCLCVKTDGTCCTNCLLDKTVTVALCEFHVPPIKEEHYLPTGTPLIPALSGSSLQLLPLLVNRQLTLIELHKPCLRLGTLFSPLELVVDGGGGAVVVVFVVAAKTRL